MHNSLFSLTTWALIWILFALSHPMTCRQFVKSSNPMRAQRELCGASRACRTFDWHCGPCCQAPPMPHAACVTSCLRLSSATCSTDSTVAFSQNFAQNSQETSCTIAATPSQSTPFLLHICFQLGSCSAVVGLGQSSWQPKKGQKIRVYIFLASSCGCCDFLRFSLSAFLAFHSFLSFFFVFAALTSRIIKCTHLKWKTMKCELWPWLNGTVVTVGQGNSGAWQRGSQR